MHVFITENNETRRRKERNSKILRVWGSENECVEDPICMYIKIGSDTHFTIFFLSSSSSFLYSGALFLLSLLMLLFFLSFSHSQLWICLSTNVCMILYICCYMHHMHSFGGNVHTTALVAAHLGFLCFFLHWFIWIRSYSFAFASFVFKSVCYQMDPTNNIFNICAFRLQSIL